MVDKEGKVEKVEGGINPDNLTVAQLENLLEIQDKILLLLLQDYKSRITNWLQVNGKGPLSAFEMNMLEDLPGCFPADENVLIPLKDEVIPEIENNESLRENIISELRSDPDFQADFDALASKFNSPADVSRSEIPDDDWDKIDLKACPKVLEYDRGSPTFKESFFQQIMLVDNPGNISGDNFLAPSGMPIHLKNAVKLYITTNVNINVNETGDIVLPNSINSDNTNVRTLKLETTGSGIVVGYENEEGDIFPATFTTNDEGGIAFNGYKDGDSYVIDPVTPQFDDKPFDIWWYNSNYLNRWESKNFCFDFDNYNNAVANNVNGYKAAGPVKRSIEYRIVTSCLTNSWKEISWSKILLYEEWMRINPFGRGGILKKVNLSQYGLRYLYQYEEDGKKYFLAYDEAKDDWKHFDKPDFHNKHDLDLVFFQNLANELGHETLDIIGFIPVAGEIADGINGLWYYIEGDAVEGSLCMVSMLPIIGDATAKGTKYTLRAIKSLKKAEAIVLSKEGFKSFSRISETLTKAGKVSCEDCLDLMGKLLSQNSNMGPTLEKVASSFADPEKLLSLLKGVDKLEATKQAAFLADISKAPLSNFIGRLNGELVDSWKKLDELGFSQAARRNIDNLKQRSIIDQYADDIANASNARKGNFGEIGADLDLNSKGYESLLSKRIDDIDAPGHNGIDGVYRKNGEYFIVEGKYTGSASLNAADDATGLTRQMSDRWIREDGRLINAVGEDLAEDILLQGYKRVLAKVAPDGSVTYKYVSETGYLTKGGGPLGDWTP